MFYIPTCCLFAGTDKERLCVSKILWGHARYVYVSNLCPLYLWFSKTAGTGSKSVAWNELLTPVIRHPRIKFDYLNIHD